MKLPKDIKIKYGLFIKFLRQSKSLCRKRVNNCKLSIQKSYFLSLHWLSKRWKNAKNCIGRFSATLVTFLLLAMFYLSGLPDCSSLSPCHKDISIAIAGLLGTILALVYSLAIVGVQIASANYSRAILHMFFRDRKAQTSVLVTFSLIVISLFLSNISKFPVWGIFEDQHIFYFQIILVGFAVDAVHYFYKRIINIHDPLLTLDSLFNDLKGSIKKSDKSIRNFAKKNIKGKVASDMPEGFNPDAASAYALAPDFDSSINYYITSIVEVAHRALPRNDYTTATASIDTTVKLVNEFIKTRADTIFLVPDSNPFLLMSPRTSIDRVITKTCEELMILNREAIRQEKETISIKIIHAFWQIVDLCLRTKVKSSEYNQNALVSMPLGYIGNCVAEAQRKEMLEVPWEFIRYIPTITSNADEKIQPTTLYLPILETTNKVILAAYKNRHEVVSKQAMVNLLHMVFLLIKKDYWQLEDLTQEVIKTIRPYFDIHRALEISSPMQLMGSIFPLFDTMSNYSLQNLCQESQCLIEEYDVEKSWIDPHYKFNKFNSILSECYREICSNHSPGKSFTMHGIIHGLEHIANVYYAVIDEAEKCDGKKRFISDLLDQLKRYIWALIWLKEISGQHADDCGNILGIVAQNYSNKGYTEITKEICKTLVSIGVASYNSSDYKVRAISSIFYDIWCVEKHLRELEDSKEADKITVLYSTKPSEISDDHWERISTEVGKFPEDFDREFNSYEPYSLLRTPEKYLIDWMKKKNKKES